MSCPPRGLVEAEGDMRTAKTALALFLFWCVLVPPVSWRDPLLGLATATLVASIANRLWDPHVDPVFSVLRLRAVPSFALRMVRRIVRSAWQVLRIVLDPRLPIAPEMIRHTVEFEREAARTTYANAISITPGTLTVDVRGDTFIVHCLDPSLATDVTSGRLARDVARLFEEAS